MSDTTALTTSLTVTLPKDMVASLESIAQQTGRDMSELAEEALAGYVALRRRHMKAIDQAIAEADAGAKRYSHAEVMAWMESWETPNELPPPS